MPSVSADPAPDTLEYLGTTDLHRRIHILETTCAIQAEQNQQLTARLRELQDAITNKIVPVIQQLTTQRKLHHQQQPTRTHQGGLRDEIASITDIAGGAALQETGQQKRGHNVGLQLRSLSTDVAGGGALQDMGQQKHGCDDDDDQDPVRTSASIVALPEHYPLPKQIFRPQMGFNKQPSRLSEFDNAEYAVEWMREHMMCPICKIFASHRDVNKITKHIVTHGPYVWETELELFGQIVDLNDQTRSKRSRAKRNKTKNKQREDDATKRHLRHPNATGIPSCHHIATQIHGISEHNRSTGGHRPRTWYSVSQICINKQRGFSIYQRQGIHPRLYEGASFG